MLKNLQASKLLHVQPGILGCFPETPVKYFVVTEDVISWDVICLWHASSILSREEDFKRIGYRSVKFFGKASRTNLKSVQCGEW